MSTLVKFTSVPFILVFSPIFFKLTDVQTPDHANQIKPQQQNHNNSTIMPATLFDAVFRLRL